MYVVLIFLFFSLEPNMGNSYTIRVIGIDRIRFQGLPLSLFNGK